MTNNGLSTQESEIAESSNFNFINVKIFLKNKREFLPMVLLAIAALSGILTVVKATGLFIASARAERIVRQSAAWGNSDPNDVANRVENLS